MRIKRNKPGKHDRFGSVPFVKCVCLLQMLPVENAALRIAEKLLADFIPDPIVRGMTENSGDREQDENDRQIQRAILGGQSSDRKQKRVSREKRSHYQPGLAKDDQKEQGIDPGTVGIGHLAEIQIQVQNDIEEFCEPVHRAKTANESVIGRISATEIKKTVPRINLNVPEPQPRLYLRTIQVIGGNGPGSGDLSAD